jgi:hypothetical protein
MTPLDIRTGGAKIKLSLRCDGALDHRAQKRMRFCAPNYALTF